MKLFKILMCLSTLTTSTLFCSCADFPDAVKTSLLKNPCNNSDPNLCLVHNNAYHHIESFSENGDSVKLENGTRWVVNLNRYVSVLDWVQSDNIFIMPNRDLNWFFIKPFKFILFNHTLQQSVEADLEFPYWDESSQTRILKIDHSDNLILLSDNTIWNVNGGYFSGFDSWKIGDRVVIGLNHRNFNSFVNIIINIDLNKRTFLEANYFGYPLN